MSIEATFRLNEGNVEIHTNDRIDSTVSKSIGKRIAYKKVIA